MSKNRKWQINNRYVLCDCGDILAYIDLEFGMPEYLDPDDNFESVVLKWRLTAIELEYAEIPGRKEVAVVPVLVGCCFRRGHYIKFKFG